MMILVNLMITTGVGVVVGANEGYVLLANGSLFLRMTITKADKKRLTQGSEKRSGSMAFRKSAVHIFRLCKHLLEAITAHGLWNFHIDLGIKTTSST